MARFKNKNRSMYNGPLSKMVKDAVDSALNDLTDDGYKLIDSKTTELDMSKDPRYESGTSTTDLYERKGQDDPYEGEKIDSDTWKNLYDEAMQGGGSEGMREYVRKYNIDGTAKAEYKEETTTDLNPAELEQIQKREVSEVPRVEREIEQKPSYLQTPVGGKNIMELFNVNPELGGNLTENAKSFFDTTFSTDNPVLEVLNDDKWMKKARKEYEKNMKKRVGSSSKSQYKYKSNMPFERWVMTRYKPKGGEGSLDQRARIWEGDNAGDTDSSQFQLPDGTDAMDREIKGAGYAAASRYKKSNPFDRYKEEQERIASEQGRPVTNMKRKPVVKMLQGRTMSFRKKR